jgi:enoyl-CoA hydratase
MVRANELAQAIAGGAAQASRIIKRVVDAGMNTTLEQGLRLELDGFVEVFGTHDSQVGVKSFLENGPGKATFTGS